MRVCIMYQINLENMNNNQSKIIRSSRNWLPFLFSLNFIAFLLLFCPCQMYFVPSPGYGAHQVTFWQGNHATLYTSGTYNTNVTLSYSYINIEQYALVFTGFDFIMLDSMSFDTSLTYLGGSTFQVGFSPINASYYCMSFMVVVLTLHCSNFMEVRSYPYNPVNASLASPPSSRHEGVNIPTKFWFTTDADFIVSIAFSSFHMLANNSPNAIDIQISYNDTGLNYTLAYDLQFSYNKTRLLFANFTIIVIYKPFSTNAIFEVFKLKSNPTHYLSQYTNLDLPTVYGFPFDKNCSVAVSVFNIPVQPQQVAAYFDLTTPAISKFLEYKIDPSSYYVYYNNLCLVECDIGYFLQNMQCVACWGVFPNCHTCNSTVCLTCSGSATMNASASSGLCQCANGYSKSSSGECIKMAGCLTAVLQNGISVCVACTIVSKFKLKPDNGSCKCIPGYTLSNNTCVDKCGDGMVFTNECDDGNLIDGDGCSSKCLIEPYFNCTNHGVVAPSNCSFIGKITMQLDSVWKKLGANEGIFKFKLSSYASLQFISKLNLEDLTNFTCNSNFIITDISYQNNILTLRTQYLTDMEGENSQFAFEVFPSMILSNPFRIKSNNIPLIINHNYNTLLKLQISLSCFAYAALLLLAVGGFFHKMVGVETIHMIQWIYLLLLPIQDLSQSLLSFSTMANSNLGYSFGIGNTLNEWFPLSFNNQFLQNTMIITAISTVSFSIYIIVKIIKSLMEDQKSRKNWRLSQKQKQRNTFYDAFFTTFYRMLLFPIAIGFMFQLFISLYVNNASYSIDYRFPSYANSICILLSLSLFGYVFYSQFFSVLLNSFKGSVAKMSRISKSYVFCYQVSSLIGITLFIGGAMFFPSVCIYLMSGYFFMELIVIAVYRPYKSRFHNFGIIMIKLTLCFFCAGILYRQSQDMSQQVQILFLIMVVGLIGTVLIISITRIVLEICLFKKKRDQQNSFQQKREVFMEVQRRQSQKIQAQNNKLCRKLKNPYTLDSQQLQKSLLIHNEINQKRELLNVQRLDFDVPDHLFIQEENINDKQDEDEEPEELIQIKNRLRNQYVLSRKF